MDVPILCMSITLYIHNTILNSAKLIGLRFVKFLNYTGYTGYMPHITHHVALQPLVTLNATAIGYT